MHQSRDLGSSQLRALGTRLPLPFLVCWLHPQADSKMAAAALILTSRYDNIERKKRD